MIKLARVFMVSVFVVLYAIFIVSVSFGIEFPAKQPTQTTPTEQPIISKPSGLSLETKGIIIINGLEVVNGKLILVSNTGKRIAIPDGTFKSADGKMIIIIGGRISEVVIPNR